jgi:hypothetical protein
MNCSSKKYNLLTLLHLVALLLPSSFTNNYYYPLGVINYISSYFIVISFLEMKFLVTKKNSRFSKLNAHHEESIKIYEPL